MQAQGTTAQFLFNILDIWNEPLMLFDGMGQGQLQEWMEHSHTPKPVVISKNHFNII